MNFVIHEINNPIFHKIVEINIINEEYFDIRNVIIKKRRNCEISLLLNTRLLTKYFITKIVYRYFK